MSPSLKLSPKGFKNPCFKQTEHRTYSNFKVLGSTGSNKLMTPSDVFFFLRFILWQIERGFIYSDELQMQFTPRWLDGSIKRSAHKVINLVLLYPPPLNLQVGKMLTKVVTFYLTVYKKSSP